MTSDISAISIILRSGIAIVALAMVGACSSSPPPRLFMLNGPASSVANGSEGQTLNSMRQAQSRQVAMAPAVRLGVVVMVPQYLDRPDMMVRTDQYELKPIGNTRWA